MSDPSKWGREEAYAQILKARVGPIPVDAAPSYLVALREFILAWLQSVETELDLRTRAEWRARVTRPERVGGPGTQADGTLHALEGRVTALEEWVCQERREKAAHLAQEAEDVRVLLGLGKEGRL